MREIKFRAWEKELKEMIKVEGIKYNPKQVIINPDGPWRTIDEVDLMQYTGLKDKNGAEIYEGDILQTTYPTSPGAKPLYKVVEWIVGHSYTGFNITNQRNNHIPREIVGNIYENGELLKNEV